MMVSGHDLGRAAANLMMKRQGRAVDDLAAFQATVISISGGFVYIQEDGPDETPWVQGIRFAKDLKLMPGCRVQIAPVRGGGYLCIGCIDDPDTFPVGDSSMYENNSGTALGSPLSSTTMTDVVTVTASGLPAGSYRV